MQRCDDVDTDPTRHDRGAQLWTHSPAGLLRDSLVSSSGGGSVCLARPYNGSDLADTSRRASVWTCCAAGSTAGSTNCSGSERYRYGLALVDGSNRPTVVVTTDPDAPVLCLTVGGGATSSAGGGGGAGRPSGPLTVPSANNAYPLPVAFAM
jgi:hypothetical protein